MTEPDLSGWRRMPDPQLAELARSYLIGPGPHLVLVDGRSAAGKTTFAERLARLLGAGLVHTDDVAWHLHPINWAEQLRCGILDPWRRGEPVRYRPPGWQAQGRPGAIRVPPVPVLVVEGVGAARPEFAADAHLVVWVRCDQPLTRRRRGIERDITITDRDRAEAEIFWDDWARFEDPFLAETRPWDRAQIVVDGLSGADQLLCVVRAGPAQLPDPSAAVSSSNGPDGSCVADRSTASDPNTAP